MMQYLSSKFGYNSISDINYLKLFSEFPERPSYMEYKNKISVVFLDNAEIKFKSELSLLTKLK